MISKNLQVNFYVVSNYDLNKFIPTFLCVLVKSTDCNEILLRNEKPSHLQFTEYHISAG